MSKWEAGEGLEIKHVPQCGWGLYEDGELIAIWPTLVDMYASFDKNFTKEED